MNGAAAGASADALRTTRNPEIFVVHANGKGARNLTRNPAYDYQPALAPDGRRLVFLRYRHSESGLWIMNRDGTHQRRLANAACPSESPGTSGWLRPSWTPDGSHIAFFCRMYDANRYIPAVGVLALASGELRWIADAEAPTWSPDGRRLAFLSDFGKEFRNPPHSIAVANADGSDRRVIARTGGGLGPPRWSPTGWLIALPAALCMGLCVLDVDDPSTVRKVATYGLDPTWSPDGSTLAFEDPGGGIWSVGADGSRLRRLVGSKKDSIPRNPEWSPVENRIAFVSGTEASGGELLVVNADGRRPHLIAKPVRTAQRPIWSRDGRKLFYVN